MWNKYINYFIRNLYLRRSTTDTNSAFVFPSFISRLRKTMRILRDPQILRFDRIVN